MAGEHAFSGTARFELLRPLGAGGMGAVYACFDRETGEEVALKTLLAMDVRALGRLKREFRRAAEVVHPNLLRLGELHASAQPWFFTMELVRGVDWYRYVTGPTGTAGQPEQGRTHDPSPSRIQTIAWSSSEDTLDAPGETLDTDAPTVLGPDLGVAPRPRPRGGLPESRFDRIRASASQLVGGLRALHAAGLVHRDIKPSNVLVNGQGRVVIVDFGLAAAQREVRGGRIVGTVATMAPEQAAGRPVGPAADLYAVGVMLFEALTGALPFEGSTLQILAQKQLQEAPPVRDHAADAPADLADLCDALLRRDPEARPGLAEVARRLGDDRHVAAELARPAEAPLVGREDVLAAVALPDEPAVVAFVGPSGVGKSRLLEATLERHAADALVLRSRCREREHVPYKALDSVVDELTDWLLALPEEARAAMLPPGLASAQGLFPGVARLDAPPGSVAPMDAVRALLARVGERASVVIAIDDLQWADPESLRMLRHVTAPPDPPNVRWVVTSRRAQAVRALAVRRVVEIPVERLDADSSLALARTLLRRRGADASRALAITELAAGHPLHLQLLAALSDARRAPPRDLDDAIATALDAHPPDAQELARTLALAGLPMRRPEIRDALGWDGVRLSAASAELERAGWITHGHDEGPTLELRHDRLRETLAARVEHETGSARRHAELAAALRNRPEEVRAHHLARSGRADEAASLLRRAAARAREVSAFERAAALHQRALELTPARGVQDLVEVADALVNAGRAREAAALYADAAARSDDAEQTTLYALQAATQSLFAGDRALGLERLRALETQAGMDFPRSPAEAAWLLLRARMGMRLGAPAPRGPRDEVRAVDLDRSVATALSYVDTLTSVALHARSLWRAQRTGDPLRVAAALATNGVIDTTSARTAGRGRARLARVAAAIPTLGADRALASAGHAAAESFAAWFQSRFVDAARWGAEADQRARHIAIGPLTPFADLLQQRALPHSSALEWSGDLPALGRVVRDVAAGKRRANRQVEHHVACKEVLLRVADGDLRQASALLRRVRSSGADPSPLHPQVPFRAVAWQALYVGDAQTFDRARATYRAQVARVTLRVGVVRTGHLWLEAQRALMGRRRSELDALRRALLAVGTLPASALARVLRAYGCEPRREAHLEVARGLLARAGMPLFAECVRLRIADAHHDRAMRRASERALHEWGVRDADPFACAYAIPPLF